MNRLLLDLLKGGEPLDRCTANGEVVAVLLSADVVMQRAFPNFFMESIVNFSVISSRHITHRQHTMFIDYSYVTISSTNRGATSDNVHNPHWFSDIKSNVSFLV